MENQGGLAKRTMIVKSKVKAIKITFQLNNRCDVERIF